MSESRGRLAAARVTGSGRSRRRLLVIGDAPLVLAGPTAAPSAVTVSTALAVRGEGASGGVDLDVLWDLTPAMRAMRGRSASWRLRRYDAVVVVLATAPARAGRIDRLLLQVLTELTRICRLLLVLPQPADRGARSRRRPQGSLGVLHRLAEAGHDVPVVQAGLDAAGLLADPTGVADALLALLDRTSPAPAGPPPARRDGPQSEAERQEAVDRSVRALSGVTADLRRVVLLARNTFDMPYAQLNLVSGGRLHSVAFAGRSSDALTGTLSELVVQGSEAVLIEDTHADRRCAEIEETRGAEAIRCYLGHPIQSTDGYRIGTLCVFDTVPHPIEQDDGVLIRDLALLAEAEIHALTSGR